MTYVFAYGSLLDPASLHATLPDVTPEDCIPARHSSSVRTYGVAFRNDGTHRDKAYLDADGNRPEVVLFCDLERGPATANGICIPVDADRLDRLRRRELRYDLVDVSHLITGYDPEHRFAGAVLAFTGKAHHRAPADVASGVVARAYAETALRGAAHWDGIVPGFLDDFHASTRAPARIADLTRIDA